MRDSAAFHIHNILWKPELTVHRDGDRGECLIDLDAIGPE